MFLITFTCSIDISVCFVTVINIIFTDIIIIIAIIISSSYYCQYIIVIIILLPKFRFLKGRFY